MSNTIKEHNHPEKREERLVSTIKELREENKELLAWRKIDKERIKELENMIEKKEVRKYE